MLQVFVPEYFLDFSPHLNFSSSHFQNRLVTVVWMQLRVIIGTLRTFQHLYLMTSTWVNTDDACVLSGVRSVPLARRSDDAAPLHPSLGHRRHPLPPHRHLHRVCQQRRHGNALPAHPRLHGIKTHTRTHSFNALTIHTGVTAGGGGVSFILLIFCTSCRCLTLNGDTVRMYQN